MHNIKFSVLIPVYNVEKFIAECIESILKQTYQNFEIILINDGSTDLSGTICEEYVRKDKRVQLYHQANEGHTMARRNAISKASGDFCLFLDSDDYWELNLLATINQTICEHNCDLVLFKYKRVSQTGVFISEADSIFKNQMIFNEDNKEQLFKKIINSSDLNNLACKAVKRSIIDNTDYSQYKEVKNAEDLLQSLPFFYESKRIVYLNYALYNYRTVSNSITHTFNVNLLKDVSIVRGVLLQYLKKLNFDSKDNLSLFYHFYIKIAINYIFRLVTSDVDKEKQIYILKQIKNSQLYSDAFMYIDKGEISLEMRVILFLMNKSHYELLFVYVKLSSIFKKIIKRLV
ncbi:glycosyltransferase family 2 protein [Bacillus cereus]|uniref:glycosyltransferase family 2 protein n=1 Tax=Bacillus cereus TaxID=1396 RepID=UPI0015CF0924|nr:glycosyltransferase family 2 protein [Bacillus cereus]